MSRTDRVAIRFALLALALQARVRILGPDDFHEAEALVDRLILDDLLRLSFATFREAWHRARYDRPAMDRLGCDLMRAVERDTWPETARARDAA